MMNIENSTKIVYLMILGAGVFELVLGFYGDNMEIYPYSLLAITQTK